MCVVQLCIHLELSCFSDRSMEVLRYRLIGPLSHSVLTDTLKAASVQTVRKLTLDVLRICKLRMFLLERPINYLALLFINANLCITLVAPLY